MTRRGKRDDETRDHHQQGEREQNRSAIDPARHRRNAETRQNREHSRYRDGLTGLALRDLEVRGDRRKKTDRHEF